MVGVPPPSSGGAAVIGAARFLAGYDDEINPDHRLVEAMKHAFAIRMSLSDPAFHSGINVTEAVDDLVSGGYMETLRRATSDYNVLPLSQYGGTKWALLNNSQGNGEATDANEGDRRRLLRIRDAQNPNFGYLEDKGTTHLSVVDREHNAVSITSSVNTHFGSGVVLGNSGILMNSQMDDFSTPGRPNFFGLQPSEANYIVPSKKPLSSMSPFLVFKETRKSRVGDLAMALGASGGPKIITAVLQTFVNYAFKKMPLFEAVANPRLHDQLLYHSNAVTLYEKAKIGTAKIEASERTRLELANTHHTLLGLGYAGAVQAIAINQDTDLMDAVSDIRKGGKPAGW
jgi:gamma-glutamyltranspeptidase